MEGEYGVPTAPIVTARFAEYVIRDGHSHGMNLRWTFPPYPVAWVSREILRQYVQGNDPVTGVKLTTEIIDALTKPLTEAEKNPEIAKKPRKPRLVEPDSEANLHQLFLRNGWTDGLPIVLPTEERVAEMLAGTGHDPQEVVGMMSVTTHEEMKEYTVEKVAVIAKGEKLLLNIGTAKTMADVTAVKKDYLEAKLAIPICGEETDRVALSRRIDGRWRLIGAGVLTN